MTGNVLTQSALLDRCLPRYMRQVLDETLRACTLGPWAGRVSDKDLMVAGHSIPANTPIIHALGVSLMNETTWKDVEK